MHLASSPDPTLSRGETFLTGRRARAGHETSALSSPSLVPRPHPKIGKGAWCHLQTFPYVPSQHITQLILIITFTSDLVRLSHGKNSKECYNWQWTNVIPLLQTKTADTAHTGIFASNTRPLSRFLGGAWGRG